jgi:hypothetical protein
MLSKEKDLGGIELKPNEKDLTQWSCMIPGPEVREKTLEHESLYRQRTH